MSDKKIRWVSFQSLIGGMCLGAEKAFGTPPLFTIDYEGPDKGNSSAYLYYQNEIKHKNIRQLVLNGNLLSMATDFKSEEDEKFFQENCHDIDVVSAVPICSGLSAANTVNDKSKGTQRGAAAQQNNNMYGVAKMTFERIKPKVFIFENAPALFTNTGKAVRDKLRDMGKEHGYVVTWVKTNTNKHANVQYRSRTFGIFWRADVTPQLEFVDKAHGSIKEYLADISKDASYNTDEWIINPKILDNGWYKYLKAKYPTNWREYLATSKRGFWENFWDKLDFTEIKPYCNEKEWKFCEHVKDKLSRRMGFYDNVTPLYMGDYRVPTIFHRTLARLVHYEKDRGYTLREFMKFMGMPDDFEWPSAKKNWVWISQNVPVMTSYDWHLQIKKYLEGGLKNTTEKETYFNNEKGPEEKSMLEQLLS